jgi:HEAT repeat protein
MLVKSIALMFFSILCSVCCPTCIGQDTTLADEVDRLGQGSVAEREQIINYLSTKGNEIVPYTIKLLDTGTANQQADAAKVLALIGSTGTNTVSKLREVVSDKARDREVRLSAAKALWRMTQDVVGTMPAIQEALRDSEKQTRLDAIDAIRAIGPAAKMAIPDLIELIDAETASNTPDYSVLIPLQIAVSAMKEEAIPALRQSLTSDNQKLVVYAATGLGQLGSAASDAVDDLYDAFYRSKSRNTQVNIASAILKTADRQAFALEVFQDALRADSEDKTGQLSAVIGLNELGAAALPAQGLLIESLGSDELKVAIVAARVLYKQGVRDERMDSIIKRALETEEMFGYLTAAKLVCEMGAEGVPFIPSMGEKLSSQNLQLYAADSLVAVGTHAVPFLIHCLSDADPEMQLRAINTLGRIGSAAADALPQLNVVITSKNETLRKAAFSAVVQVSGNSGGALSAQMAALGNSDVEIRLNAIRNLSEETILPPALLPTLGKLLGDSHPQIRSFAALIIGTFGQAGRTVSEELVKAFENEKDDAAKASMALAIVQIAENDIRALAAYGLVLASEKNTNHRIDAAMDINKFGRTAVPYLTHALSDQDTEVIAAAAWGLSTLGASAKSSTPKLIALLRHVMPPVRAAALNAIGKVAIEDSQELVTQIIELIKTDTDPDVKREGIEALGILGTPEKTTIEFLLDEIENSKEQIELRRAAANSLWRIAILFDVGDHAARICNSLNPNDDPSVLQMLCFVLERLGANTISALPALRQIAMDKSKDDKTRNNAIDAIRVLQKQASGAAGDMLSILKDPKQHPLHQSAALTIESIGSSAADIPELTKLLDTTLPAVSWTICRILGSHRADADSAKDALLSLCQNADSPQLRGSALQSLCMIAPNTPGLPKLVERALLEPNPELQVIAAQAVMSLDTNAKSLLPTLKVALKIKNVVIQTAVLDALGALGADAREVVPDLIEMLRSDVPKEFGVGLSFKIASALGQIGAEATQAAPALMEALKPDKSFYERKAIVDALDQIGLNNDPKHTAKLVSMLTASSDFPYFRIWAARTLSQLGPIDKSAIVPLIQSLEDNAVGVRLWGAAALGAYGSDARGAVDALRKRLKDRDERVVAVAIRALGDIGKEAAPVVPEISEFTLSKNDEIVTNACLALGRIGVFSD